VLVLADDHSSPTLEWLVRAPAGGFTVEVVGPPADHDWTAALLAAIARPGAEPLALASISSVHWADGGLIDLAAVVAALRVQCAALLVDATHHAGVLPLDVVALDPDFVVFPTYKWLLGPYGRAFLYVAPRWQDGVPLEQTASGRRGVMSERAPYFADLAYTDGAKRFDMGERDHFISLEMAAVGMEMMAAWGQAAIAARLGMLNARIAAGLEGLPVRLLPEALRAPHVLSLGFDNGMPAGFIEALAEANVHVAPRLAGCASARMSITTRQMPMPSSPRCAALSDLPGREMPADARDMGLTFRAPALVHARQVQPVQPAPLGAKPAQAAADHLVVRPADVPQQPQRRAVAGHHRDAADICQQRLDRVIGDAEGDAGQPDAVEPALQHRRHAVPPGRIDQHQRLRPAQRGDMVRDAGLVLAGRVAMPMLLGPHRGVEALGIKVAQFDGVASGLQRLSRRLAQRSRKTVGARVAGDQQHMHRQPLPETRHR
jgi:hypothetical protein